MTRIAINGLGRIGRAAFKQIIEDGSLDVVAVNDLAPVEDLAYLLKHDSCMAVTGVTFRWRAAA